MHVQGCFDLEVELLPLIEAKAIIKGGEYLLSSIYLCQFQIVVNELTELFFKMFHTAFKIDV